MAVFVLDRSGKPLMPCSEKRARKLLAAGRARVHRVMPFVIRIVDLRMQDSALQPLRIKIDPDDYGYAWSTPCTRSLPSASTQLNTGKNNFPVSSRLLTGRLRLNVATKQASQGGGIHRSI